VRTIRLSLAEGALSQVFLNWTTGSVLVGYMLHLGLPVGQVAMVSAVPQLAQLMNPVAAYLVAAIGHRKGLTIALALAARLTWLAAAALPLVALPDALKPAIMFGIVLLSSTMLAGATTLWTSWMGDVVPASQRGRVFGLRTGLAGFVGTGANLAAGAFLDRVAAPVSFQVVLVVAVAVAVVGALLLVRHQDAPSRPERVTWRELVTLPWADRSSRVFLRFTVFWAFAVSLAEASSGCGRIRRTCHTTSPTRVDGEGVAVVPRSCSPCPPPPPRHVAWRRSSSRH
jgi:hypothetical protein